MLARQLATRDGVEVESMLHLVSDPAAHAQAPPKDVAAAIVQKYQRGPAPIGIWKPQQQGDETVFVRDESALTRDWWAPNALLRPKRTLLPLRVCVLGESTAAGWFYAPALTPTKVLQEQLRSIRGDGIFETIDLTMVNMQPSALVDLAGAALQLTPDVLVVFAGNNWSLRLPTFPTVSFSDAQQAALALQHDGMAGLSRLSVERTSREAARTLDTIAYIAEGAGIATVLVIPEVNLPDWRRDRPVAWLPGDGCTRWYSTYRQTLDLFNRGEHPGAEALARQLLQLDAGLCATSHRLLGDALGAQGRGDEARRAYAHAVDARGWDNFPSTPSVTSAIRQQMRDGAERHGMSCVDLSMVFEDYAGSSGGGRRLFLDYCHLTAEGMAVAMAAVAVEILRLSSDEADYTWQALLARSPELQVPAETDALVKFLTALYNAHFSADRSRYSGRITERKSNDSLDTASYWLREAVAASPQITETMLAYVGTRTAPATSGPISKEQQSLHQVTGALERESAYSYGLDPDVVSAILSVVSHDRPAIERSLLANHGVRRAAIDLLHPMYQWNPADRFETAAGFAADRRAFYRSVWPVSEFCLVSDATQDVMLDFVARLPALTGTRTATIEVVVNGQSAVRHELSDTWRHGTCRLSRALLRRGFNRISVRWPELVDDGDAAISAAIERLRHGIPVDLHPIFGDLFSLTAYALS